MFSGDSANRVEFTLPPAPAPDGTLAWWLALSNRPKEAIVYAQKGLTLNRGEAWIAINLIDGYVLDNQFEEAVRIYSDYKEVTFKSGATFAGQVKSDFKTLRARGVDSPAMQRFESWLVSVTNGTGR